MTILLTGATGNIGHEVALRLAGHRVIALVRPGSTLAAETEAVIHCAASTAFRAPLAELRAINVGGTGHLLAFAARCPHLRQFVHVSTACVCGAAGGLIPEAPLPLPPAFVNAYEQSKWEAEQLVLAARLPACIVRLSIVAGSQVDGSVRRLGALHHMLWWLWKGLIPMMPGAADTPVDLISTEYAAQVIVAAVHARAPSSPIILHGCAGFLAPCLGDLLQHVAAEFSLRSPVWRSGSIEPPAMVDAATFAMFEQTVLQSGDVLFRRVCEDSRSFLPGLLHPRRYATAVADSLCPPPPLDWRHLATLVTRHVLTVRTR